MNRNKSSKNTARTSSSTHHKKEEHRKEESVNKYSNKKESKNRNKYNEAKHGKYNDLKHGKYNRGHTYNNDDSSSENSDNQYINELSHRAIKYDNKCTGSRWQKKREYRKRHTNLNESKLSDSEDDSDSSQSSSSGSSSSDEIKESGEKQDIPNYFRKDSIEWGCLEVSTKDNMEFVSDNFIAVKPSEVSVHIGEHIQVLDTPKQDWWYVQKLSGQKGLVPISCVAPELSSRITRSVPKVSSGLPGRFEILRLGKLYYSSISESSEEEQKFDYSILKAEEMHK